jgi:hypothetical protein
MRDTSAACRATINPCLNTSHKRNIVITTRKSQQTTPLTWQMGTRTYLHVTAHEVA